jgi:leukotriene-A4 hydrolase
VWIEGTGIPPDAMEPDSATYRKICTLAAEFKSGKIPSEDEVADWSGQEWELYLENLSKDVEASQVCIISEQQCSFFLLLSVQVVCLCVHATYLFGS